MNRMITIQPDGSYTTKHYALGGRPSLKDMQGEVGGLIETLPYFEDFYGEPCVAYCNEEGLLEGLPVNVCASVLWGKVTGEMPSENALCVGPVVLLVGDPKFRGEA